MSMMLWMGPAIVGTGLGAVAVGVVGRTSVRRSSSMALRTIVGNEVDTREAELSAPLSERLLGPAGQALTKVARAVTPSTMVARLRQNTSLAGLGGLGVEGALALKAAGAAVVAIVLPAVMALLGVGFGNVILLGLIGAAIGFMLPDVFIASKGKSRQDEIRKALPETLDLLAIAVGAGMGLEAAIDLVIQRLPGALGEEFHRILQELSLGVSRRPHAGRRPRHTAVGGPQEPGARDADAAPPACEGAGGQDPGRAAVPAAARHLPGTDARGHGPGDHLDHQGLQWGPRPLARAAHPRIPLVIPLS